MPTIVGFTSIVSGRDRPSQNCDDRRKTRRQSSTAAANVLAAAVNIGAVHPRRCAVVTSMCCASGFWLVCGSRKALHCVPLAWMVNCHRGSHLGVQWRGASRVFLQQQRRLCIAAVCARPHVRWQKWLRLLHGLLCERAARYDCVRPCASSTVCIGVCIVRGTRCQARHGHAWSAVPTIYFPDG